MIELQNYKTINPYSLKGNLLRMLNSEWMLITAGIPESFNTMTASWGGFGVLWRKPVATIYIRPQRYTFDFVEKSEVFTLSFFGDNYRDALNFCGSKSGRDFNKPKETGLTPVATPLNGIAFKEARLIMDCRKLYSDDINPSNFIVNSIKEEIYPQHDFHRFYIAEIASCYELGVR